MQESRLIGRETTSSVPYEAISRLQLEENSGRTAMETSGEKVRRPLKPGLYVPMVTFFQENEDLDETAIAEHAVRMAQAGVTGIITQGTFGEAAHLSHHERCVVTQTTSHAVAKAGFVNLPIIVGCGAQSVREAIELCRDAQASEGDYALVLPPFVYKTHVYCDSISEFFESVADASPIPILLYNYPEVTGVDLYAEQIIKLARHHNIIGCKLTCSDMGKLYRIIESTSDQGSEFMCFKGSADVTVQTLIGGGAGIMTGLANIAPRTCVKLLELYHHDQRNEFRCLQKLVARADVSAAKAGIPGIKWALREYYGYGGFARRPLPRFCAYDGYSPNEIREVMEYEHSL